MCIQDRYGSERLHDCTTTETGSGTMSSKQGSGTLGRVIDRVRPERAPSYECGFCGLSYDTDRLNCPACGGPVDER